MRKSFFILSLVLLCVGGAVAAETLTMTDGSSLAGDIVKFEFDGRGGETLIFRRTEMVAATDDILNDNGVRSQASPDLMPVWQSKPAP